MYRGVSSLSFHIVLVSPSSQVIASIVTYTSDGAALSILVAMLCQKDWNFSRQSLGRAFDRDFEIPTSLHRFICTGPSALIQALRLGPFWPRVKSSAIVIFRRRVYLYLIPDTWS